MICRGMEQMFGKRRWKRWISWVPIFLLSALPVPAAAAGEGADELLLWYREYEAQFEAIVQAEDIEKNGYEILEEHVFPVVFESFGEEELTLIPAMNRTWRRLALFVADQAGGIRYKCSQLATNECIPGSMMQVTRDIASVAFADVDRNGLTDIILIKIGRASCRERV